MLESKIQASLIKQLERQGYYVVRLISTNKPGIPDLLLLKNGQASFIEVKRKGGKVSPLQLQRHLELAKHFIPVQILIENHLANGDNQQQSGSHEF